MDGESSIVDANPQNWWARVYVGFALTIMAGGVCIILFGIFIIATAQPKRDAKSLAPHQSAPSVADSAPSSFIILESDAPSQQAYQNSRRLARSQVPVNVAPGARDNVHAGARQGGARGPSALCACLSPRNSDDDDDSWPTASTPPLTSGGPNAQHTSHSVAGQLMQMCRGLRARLAVSADAGNQELTPMAFRAVQSRAADGFQIALRSAPYPVHTTIEYTHWLVPCLQQIFAAPYYWGVMDRFEAEKLLAGQPEGTFLLRDSQQEEYLFSVSFRRYQRTLHARIEHKEHRFSFDSFDPGVFSAPTVTALVVNYKDPARCLFFEPQLSRPLPRPKPFSLQQLCLSAVSDALRSYDEIETLPLPDKFRTSLRRYHYKQPVRVNNTPQQNSSAATCGQA